MDDEESKRWLKKAEAGHVRGIDPHMMDQLKKKIEVDQKKKEVKENQKKAIEGLHKQQEKMKKDMQEKGIASTTQKMDVKQLMEAADRKQDADKAVGGTEQATGSVG